MHDALKKTSSVGVFRQIVPVLLTKVRAQVVVVRSRATM